MLKRLLSSTALAAIVAVSAAAPHDAHAQTVLRFSNWIPPTHPISREVIGAWAKQVEEATQGSVKVQVAAANVPLASAQFVDAGTLGACPP